MPPLPTTLDMHGDIKGAFLSDTDATNVSASTNLVTNGTFDSNNDSWNGSGISSLHNSFTTSQSSGYLIVNSNTNSGSYYGVSQNVTTTTGTEYMLSFDIVSGGTEMVQLELLMAILPQIFFQLLVDWVLEVIVLDLFLVLNLIQGFS